MRQLRRDERVQLMNGISLVEQAEAEQKHCERCDMCDSVFRFGHHAYHGKAIMEYQMIVCRTCWDGNWDGWNPRYEAKLETHLKQRGIPLPERNEKGLYPRGS